MNAQIDTMKTGSILAATPAGNGLIHAEAERAVAETKAKIFLAKQFPRDQKEALDRILNSCARPTLAAKALYSYARGGQEITGPSIRLAEAIAQEWGNIEFGIREIEQRNGESIVESYAWDMQTNTVQRKIFTVRHYRKTKTGGYNLEDPRDIYEMVANNGARRLRACLLGIIPGDIVEAASDKCKDTLTINWKVTPDNIKAMLEKFAAFNVTKEMIEKRIQRTIESMTPGQMVNLGTIMNSLNDGMSNAADWFEMPAPPSVDEVIDGAKKKIQEKLEKDQGQQATLPVNPTPPES